MRSLVLRWSVAVLLGSAWGWLMTPPASNASGAGTVVALQQR